jgi:hypothetical protein
MRSAPPGQKQHHDMSGDVGEDERGHSEALVWRCGELQWSLLDICTQHILLIIVEVSASTRPGPELLCRWLAEIGRPPDMSMSSLTASRLRP